MSDPAMSRLDRNDEIKYPGCEGARMAGIPVTTGTYLPTESLQWPLTTKLTYTATGKTQDNDYTAPAPSPTSTTTGNGKRAATMQLYRGDSASTVSTPMPSPVTIDASKSASITPAGPGRRQLTRV